MAGGGVRKHRPAITGRALGYRAVQVLAFVRATIEQRGYAPSYGEICSELGIGTKGEVSDIVRSLERRGLLMRVGRGRVRRGKQWNRPILRLVHSQAFPAVDPARSGSNDLTLTQSGAR